MRPRPIRFAAATMAAGCALAFSCTANAALLGRDLNGSPDSFEAYYDDVLDVTWLANANLAATQTFGVSGIASNGLMTWQTANAWITAMNAADYLGVTTWRLPTLSPVDGVGFNAGPSVDGSTDQGFNFTGTQSELAYNYYRNLGGLAQFTTEGYFNDHWGIVTGASGQPFANIDANNKNLSNSYWSGLATSPEQVGAWVFAYATGGQGTLATVDANKGFAWAVASGDVAAVPEPESVALLLAGLGVVGLATRRRRVLAEQSH